MNSRKIVVDVSALAGLKNLDDMQNKETVSGNKAKEIAISILSNEV